jgi:hypothetical protein
MVFSACALSLGVALAADAPPREDAPCAALAAWFSARALPAVDQPPTEWWREDPPCPPAHELIGAAPPRGRDVSCTLGGRRDGPQTMFSEEGQLVLETRWARGVEIGPRIERERATSHLLRITPLDDALRDGEVIEWQADGAVVVSTFRRGLKSGPTFALDADGSLTRVESWRDDLRHGRSCAWTGGALGTDQLYRLGAVVR